MYIETSYVEGDYVLIRFASAEKVMCAEDWEFTARAAVDEHFENEGEALAALSSWMDDEECVDNYRSSFLDDEDGMWNYVNANNSGCCGFADIIVWVANRMFIMGCNYGH